jgi:hypothetical protein
VGRLIAGAALLGLLLLALGPGPAQAGERVQRYSGRVERVELVEGLVIVDEMGAKGHRHRHQLYVSADTPIVTAARLRPWAAAFEEVPVSLVDLIRGDFVVVESTESDGRTVALRIVIVEAIRRVRP